MATSPERRAEPAEACFERSEKRIEGRGAVSRQTGTIYYRVERNQMIKTKFRYLGSLIGLAAGDALGTTLEFKRPGSFTPLTDIVGGGPFHLRKGERTDNTSMALCFAYKDLILRLAEQLFEMSGLQ